MKDSLQIAAQALVPPTTLAPSNFNLFPLTKNAKSFSKSAHSSEDGKEAKYPLPGQSASEDDDDEVKHPLPGQSASEDDEDARIPLPGQSASEDDQIVERNLPGQSASEDDQIVERNLPGQSASEEDEDIEPPLTKDASKVNEIVFSTWPVENKTIYSTHDYLVLFPLL